MSAADFFSTDYAAARDRFRAAASRLGVQIESHVIASKGPRGELLSIDVATVGPARCRRVVIVSSGLHGVEGFFGSAVQLAWLAKIASAPELPNDVKIVLVHALNPFGFAWLRRWTEHNVDLNRNFLTDRAFLDSAPYRSSLQAYERLDSFLNPASPPSPWEPYPVKAVATILGAGCAARRRLPAGQRPSMVALGAIARLGLAELQKTLPVGQYQHADGLFYGGDGPQETTVWIQERLPAWVAGAELTLHLDFHSGLGKRAEYKLLLVDPKGSPQARWAAERFGDDVVEAADGGTAYPAHGTMAGYFRDRHLGGRYYGLTAEFGTYPGMRVLGALRAENRAHFHADPTSSNYRWAKRQIREAFAPAAKDWREEVIRKSLDLVDRAVSVCRSAAPEHTAGTSGPDAVPTPAPAPELPGA